MAKRTRLALCSCIAGALWGCLAYLLGARAFGQAIWGGVLASPLIGVTVGHLLHSSFADGTGRRRILWSLVSLYLAAVLFGTSVGVYELVLRRSSASSPTAVVIESIAAVLWGVTLTGFLLFLWPLAYLTHWALEWQVE
ncbi:MAG TPA: hypothetical protein VH879_05930 [Gemmatimonadales bacterium]